MQTGASTWAIPDVTRAEGVLLEGIPETWMRRNFGVVAVQLLEERALGHETFGDEAWT